MASIKKSSFHRRGEVHSNSINGTKPSLHNSQLLISSGIASLDNLIGGGIPVGSILLINEDEYGSYAKFILKYFLAEGIVSKHEVFVCSKDINTEELVQQLPNPIDADFEDENKNEDIDKKMTIAWRYENLKTHSSFSHKHTHFGHYFDLSKTINPKFIQNSSITYWSGNLESYGDSFQDTCYSSLLSSIRKKINEGQFFASQMPSQRNILRIGLHHLSSPLWSYDSESKSDINSVYFYTFLYNLRSLIRNAFATVVITLPFSKYKKSFMEKCIHLSDIALQLQSFAGTKCENIAPYKDYHGFFIIQKIAAINCILSHNPGVTNLAFKLKRRKLVIEEFHLPPELEDSAEREQDDSVLTCASSKSNKYDF